MSKQKIGSFNIGGFPWSVELDNEDCEQERSRYLISHAHQTIKIRNDYGDGRPLLRENGIMNTLWEAIMNTLIIGVMENRKFDSDILKTYASFVQQITNTLTSTPKDWNGTFYLGGKQWKVVVDNNPSNTWYGLCHGDIGVVYLTTEGKEGPYSIPFIGQTLWHELLHSIAYELGKSKEKMNSEKFVNILSVFVYEVDSTLVIEIPDE